MFLHFLKVSGAAALSGEAIAGCHSDGRYYLTKARDELAYYRKRAQQLLDSASPLIDIYRADRAVELKAFLRADAATGGRRRDILSSLPLYTMDADALDGFLQRRQLPEQERQEILVYAAFQRELAEQTLAQTRQFEKRHPGYTLVRTKGQPFRFLVWGCTRGGTAGHPCGLSRPYKPVIMFIVNPKQVF